MDAGRVKARGASWDDETLDRILRSRVLDLLADSRGADELRDLLEELPRTDFERDRLEETLAAQPALEPWRVSEALAEAFLSECRGCFFPWPTTRDLKNPSSSPAGADLVGFDVDGSGDRFAFGEVKASEDEESPPNVMYGRSGLVKQLEKLRDDVSVKTSLVRYLGFRAPGTDWQEKFQDAARRYFCNPSDLALFGVLVRDTAPNALDLRTRARALSNGHPPETSTELRAKYLPRGTLARLTQLVEERLGDAGH